MKLEGIHHVTAITADAQANVDFYAGVLGLRLVKKTVNQDEPERLPPVLRRRARQRRLRHHLLRVSAVLRKWSCRCRHDPSRSTGGWDRRGRVEFWAERIGAARASRRRAAKMPCGQLRRSRGADGP